MILQLLMSVSSVLNRLPPSRPGQGSYLNGWGDSIAKAYPLDDDTKSYQRFTSDVLGGVSYSASGHDNYRTDEILALFNADVISQHPSIGISEGGVNDVAQGRANNLIVADLQNMIDQAVADGIFVVHLPIMPYTAGTTLHNQNIDSINATMIAWMASEHPTHLVADVRPVIGQFRPGGDEGNLWDYKDGYSDDGIHPTEATYQIIGERIGEIILDSL